MKKWLMGLFLVVVVAAGAFYFRDHYAQWRISKAKAALSSALDIEDDAKKVEALDAFLEKYGGVADTSVKANYARFATYADLEGADDAHLFRYAEAMDKATAGSPRRRQYLNAMAFEFADKKAHLDKAEAWAREALALYEKDGEKDEIANVKDTLAFVLFESGRAEEALPFASDAANVLLEETTVLARAGKISEAAGKKEDAAGYYLRSLAVFGNDDKEGLYEGHLLPLYTELHGSDKGLAENLASAREKAKTFTIFDSRRVAEPKAAPDWNLPSFDSEGSLASMRGNVVLLKFWGMW